MKPSPTMTMDIVIPVYNEERFLVRQIEKLLFFLGHSAPAHWKLKVIIADNGSQDQTPNLAQGLSMTQSAVDYVQVEEKGVGRALQLAWDTSTADFVGFMDLDLATDLKHLPEVLDRLEKGRALVVGNRLHPNSQVLGRSFKREIISRIFNRILHSYLRVRFSDGMCGFKFLKRDLYQKLKDSGLSNVGWFFSTELLIRSEWLGVPIDELPIRWTDQKESKARVLPLTLQYLREMKKLKHEKIIW